MKNFNIKKYLAESRLLKEEIDMDSYIPKIKEVIQNPEYQIEPNSSHMSEAEQVWHYLTQDFPELHQVNEAEYDQINDFIESELSNHNS
tara:strand:- start:12 stop:278 length:267 start_codon:yes stop_codon:yes gene_type:complete